MATNPPPELPPENQPAQPATPPPEIVPPSPDVDIPSPGEQPTGPANPVG